MKVHFWGTRGSIPVSLTAADIRAKLIAALAGAATRQFKDHSAIETYVDGELDFAISGTFGGHTSCVQIDCGASEHLICDLGSGARPFGNAMLERHGPSGQTYHVLMSHLHWDHIMGFPFFAPAYVPGNRIVIHGCHAGMAEAFRQQHSGPGFPVDFEMLGAQIEFDLLQPGQTREIAGLRVTPMLQLHAGDSYGYRIEHAASGKRVVYSTDSEHKLECVEETEAFVEFFRAADLVIFDAMYSLAESISIKADWGHSSNIVGVELCQLAGAKRLCMFHHEPAYDDAQIARILAETRRFEEITRDERPALEVIAAYDGLEIVL